MTITECPITYKEYKNILERKFFDKWKNKWRDKCFEETWKNKPGEEIRHVMNKTTGENVLHYLAREGKLDFLKELCESKLKDPHEKIFILDALRQVDNFDDTPMLSAFNAPKFGIPILKYLLSIVAKHTKNKWLQKETVLHTNRNKDTILTKLTSYKINAIQEAVDLSESKKLIYKVFIQYYTKQNAKCFYEIFMQVLQNNSCEISEVAVSNILNDIGAVSKNFFDENVFHFKNKKSNTILMELAKKGQDDALKELMSDRNTKHHFTHAVLKEENKRGETLLSIMEVNRANLTESLAFVLRKEYSEFHNKNMLDAERCISNQVDSSISSFQMIQDLNGVENSRPCWSKLQIIIVLFLFTLVPTIGPTVSDILADSYLSIQYYNEWVNETRGEVILDQYGENITAREELCMKCRSEWWNGTLGIHVSNISGNTAVSNTTVTEILDCYEVCLSPEARFWYTTGFICLQLLFYLAEFLTLTDKYEVTGMRKAVKEAWKDITTRSKEGPHLIIKILKLKLLLLSTTIVVILWLPVTGFIKFYVDYKYETANEYTRVKISKRKKRTDFAAARGELIEVNAESSTEPIIQSYIIFPNLYHIVTKLNGLITWPDGNMQINRVEFTSIELSQLFAIITSIISLAWCYSEYHSVKKKYYLDILTSPCSRIIMFLFMLLLIISRLLLFQLFAFYWEPGSIYPVFIFLLVHMLICSILHVFFSEEIIHLKKSHYLKFIHNVLMNALGTIYFHNFFQMDDAQITDKNDNTENPEIDIEEDIQASLVKFQENNKQETNRSKRHVSTFERQKYFGLLYFIEFLILLYFGMSSYLIKNGFIGFTEKVINLKEAKHDPDKAWYKWWLFWVIVGMTFVGVILRVFYYSFLHIMKNSICTCTRIERAKKNQLNGKLRRYVIVSENTWFLGKLRRFESSLMILPECLATLVNDQFEQLKEMVSNQIDEHLNLISSVKYWKSNLRNIGKWRKMLALVFGPILVFLGIMITILLIIVLLLLLILSIIFVIPFFITKTCIRFCKIILTCPCMKEEEDDKSKIIIKYHYVEENNQGISYRNIKQQSMTPEETKQWLIENPPEKIWEFLKSRENLNKSVDLDSKVKIIITKLEVAYKKPLRTRSWDPNTNLTTRYDIFKQLTAFLPYTDELIIDGLLHHNKPQGRILNNEDERKKLLDKFGECLAEHKHLKFLAMKNCSIFKNEDLNIEKFVKGLETLKAIDFGDNKDIDSKDLNKLLEVAKKKVLKKLVLKNANLKNQQFDEILISFFGVLEEVDLEGCCLSETLIPGINKIFSNAQEKVSLKELDLRNCKLKENEMKALHQITTFGENSSAIFINFQEFSKSSAKFDQNFELKKITDNLMHDGILDLSHRHDILKDDLTLQTIVDFTAKLNQEKYKMKILNLNNCNLSEKKLRMLAPLISQFHTVQLGGKQGFLERFPDGIKYLFEYLYGEENEKRNKYYNLDNSKGDLSARKKDHLLDSAPISGRDVVDSPRDTANIILNTINSAVGTVTDGLSTFFTQKSENLVTAGNFDNVCLKRLEFKSDRYTHISFYDNIYEVNENSGCFDKVKRRLLNLSWINEGIEESKYIEERYKLMEHIIKFIPYLDELVLDGFLHQIQGQIPIDDGSCVEDIWRKISQRPKSNPMKYVSMRDCNVKKLTFRTESNEESIEGLINIKEVDISANEIEEESWESMADFLERRKGESKLSSFIFQNNDKKIIVGSHFERMLNKIENIDFKGCQFDADIIERFAEVINGNTHLDLTGCNLNKEQREKLKEKGVCITLSSEAQY